MPVAAVIVATSWSDPDHRKRTFLENCSANSFGRYLDGWSTMRSRSCGLHVYCKSTSLITFQKKMSLDFVLLTKGRNLQELGGLIVPGPVSRASKQEQVHFVRCYI
jgi:hypothetical protein